MENYTKEQEEELNREYLAEKANYQSNNANYGKYTNIVNKMRGFLSIAGEKTNKDTKELYREHIPQSVFGISSDEIASGLGIDENELMAKITDGLKIKQKTYVPTKIRIAKIILSEVERRIRREQKRIARIKEKFGCVFYGELRTGLPLNALYYLGGEE